MRTFSRFFARTDAEAFNAAVYGYLAARPPRPARELPAVTRHEREPRRAAGPKPEPHGVLGHAAADGKTFRGIVRPDGTPGAPAGDQPNACAAIRNPVTGAFRHAGYAKIAHARRYSGRDDQCILALYGYS